MGNLPAPEHSARGQLIRHASFGIAENTLPSVIAIGVHVDNRGYTEMINGMEE